MATTFYEIPLSGVSQNFNISLGGILYKITVMWRDCAMGGWFLDISDSAGMPIVQGIPLVTGADLLAQYTDLNFGGRLLVASDGSPDAIPTYENLGTSSHLYFAVSS